MKGELDKLLLSASAPYSEFELIQQLKSGQDPVLSADTLADNLQLFRTHFMIFHCLYQLQQDYGQQQLGYLHISALAIELIEGNEHSGDLALPDPLRDYYLDLQQLLTTDATDVEALLDCFWQDFVSYQQSIPDPQTLASAYQRLNLEPNTPFAQVKRQYRRLMQNAHPDKGGDTAECQALQAAYSDIKAALAAEG